MEPPIMLDLTLVLQFVLFVGLLGIVILGTITRRILLLI